jgi:IPT/TIG domain-containing protein
VKRFSSGVTFDGVTATFDNVANTYITSVVPAAALTGSVAVSTFTKNFKSSQIFLVRPQFGSFSPGVGIVGSSVTITGVSLTQAIQVMIGGKSASFKVNSDLQVTATVPGKAKTGQKISITTPGGTAVSSLTFAVEPFIGSFSPGEGPVGTPVTIKGTTFTGTNQVTFGGVAASSFQVISDSEVDALVPTGAKTGTIQVTTPGGTGTSATNFVVTQ